MTEETLNILLEDKQLEICLNKIKTLRERADVPPAHKRSLQLLESLSGNDWSKFGVMFAILWAKIDRVIELIDKAGKTDEQSLKELQKITTSIRTMARG